MSKVSALALGLLLALGASTAIAQEGHGVTSETPAKEMERSGMGHMGMEMGKSGMEHKKDMQDMRAHMRALQDHSKMMEGMTDQKEIAEEMKKHMRMMDEMMEKMMKRHVQSTEGTEPTP